MTFNYCTTCKKYKQTIWINSKPYCRKCAKKVKTKRINTNKTPSKSFELNKEGMKTK